MSQKSQEPGVASQSPSLKRSEEWRQIRHGLAICVARSGVRGVGVGLQTLMRLMISGAALAQFFGFALLFAILSVASFDPVGVAHLIGNPLTAQIAFGMFVILPALTLAACSFWEKRRPLEGGLAPLHSMDFSWQWDWLFKSDQLTRSGLDRGVKWADGLFARVESSGRARDLAPAAGAALLTPLLAFAVYSWGMAFLALAMSRSAWETVKGAWSGLRGAKGKAASKTLSGIASFREKKEYGLKRLREEGALSESFRQAQRRALDQETQAASKRGPSKRL